MPSVFLPIAFGAAAAIICLLAVVLVRLASGFTRANASLFAAFAAGLLISVAILHLIPEAIAMAPNAPLLILAGFAGGFILHRLLEGRATLTAADGVQRTSALAAAPVAAIAAHSFLDGGIYAVSLAADAFIGLQVVIGLMIHELPETVICFVLLQRAGLSNRAAGIGAFLAAGATTLIATVIAAPLTASLSPVWLGAAFAVVAGLMLHVGAGHLMDEAAERGWLRATPALAAGGALALVMNALHVHPHAHDHSHGHAHSHGHDDHNHGDHAHAHDHDHDHGPVHDHAQGGGSVRLGDHVHGLAQLDVAADGEGALEAILMSAAYNIVGFERVPRDEDEAARVRLARATLRSEGLVVLNAEAGCARVATTIQGGPPAQIASEQAHSHDDHAHSHDHDHGDPDDGRETIGYGDYVVTWTYACASPAQLHSVDAGGLLAAFPRIETLELTYLDGEVAAADRLDHGSPRLSGR